MSHRGAAHVRDVALADAAKATLASGARQGRVTVTVGDHPVAAPVAPSRIRLLNL
jgi:hypothetical protein